MNIEDLELFIALNEYKTIAKTSTELFISHSTLSYRLAALEDEVGKMLFIRGKGQNQLMPTDAGKKFLLIAERMYALYKEALHELSCETSQLTVIGVDSINNYFMVDFYRYFMEKYPYISLSILNGFSSDIPIKISQGIFDVGISNEPGFVNHIKSEILFKEDYVCLKRKFAEDLNHDEYISPRDLDPTREFYQKFDADFTQWHNSVFPDSHPQFNAETAHLNALLMSNPEDWTIIPHTVARLYTDRQTHSAYKLTLSPPQRTVYLVTSKNKNSYNAENIDLFRRELIQYTRSYFREW